MNPSITLSPQDRNALLRHYRRSPDPRLRTRAHLALLLADGYPWALIAAVLYTAGGTIGRWRKRWHQRGLDALRGHDPGRPGQGACWAALIVSRVLTRAPADFGLARSRLSCEAVAVVLAQDYHQPVGRETIRRCLRAAGLVWRRPRPVPRPRGPGGAAKLAALRALLHWLP